MSIDMINAKVKEQRELRRMADELAREIEAIQDEIKKHLLAATDNTERAAIVRVALQDFTESLDDINREIIAGKIGGMTERELASINGISNVAIHNRIAKMEHSCNL